MIYQASFGPEYRMNAHERVDEGVFQQREQFIASLIVDVFTFRIVDGL